MSDIFSVPDADKNYVYRWVNTDERAMLKRLDQGYEVCKFNSPEIPQSVKPDLIPAPDGTARRRGSDLILCRIPKDAFERNIEAKRRENRDRHAGAIDSIVGQARENAERAARAAGLPAPAGPLVFKDTAGAFKS